MARAIFATKSASRGHPRTTLCGRKSKRQRASRSCRQIQIQAKSSFCEACEMVSTDGRDSQGRAALTVTKEAKKEANKTAAPRSPSKNFTPAEKFDVDRDEPAIRAGRLQVQAQRSQRLHEYYDEALAEIRASLER
jgi:hypothetical protein